MQKALVQMNIKNFPKTPLPKPDIQFTTPEKYWDHAKVGDECTSPSYTFTAEHPVLGKIRLPNLPFRFSGCDTSPSGPAPMRGQHNREIAASVGYSAQEIDTLVHEGVLYAEESAKHLGKKKS